MEIKNRIITITLEDDEIDDFWNIVAFALDLHSKEKCMTTDEFKLAKALHSKVRY